MLETCLHEMYSPITVNRLQVFTCSSGCTELFMFVLNVPA